MALTEKIIGVESGGRRYAKNPRSSAYGPGQFISGTWMQMIEKYRPDLMQGRSRAEVLELRSDPKISREMTDAYARENAEYLKSRGLEPTEGNTYLSHFAGPEGAAALLSNPNAPAKSVLSPAAIEANPFLAGWSSRQVIDWASGKMGGQPTAAAKSEGSTGGMLDEALTASSAKGGKMDPLSMLLALAGGNPATAASIGLGTEGSATALNAATGAAAAPQTTVPGDVARMAGAGETGGMLDDIFGGSTISLGGGSGGQKQGGGDSGEAEAKAGQNMLAELEAMDKQMLAAVMQPNNPKIDMTRLAQILQQRSSLGV
jgi:hypothetical protein